MPTLRWAAGGILLIGLVARVLGVLREMLLANYFGVGAELDAVFLGLALPMALTLGIGGGLSRVVVPIAAPLARTRFAGLFRRGTLRLVMILGPVALALAITAPFWVELLAIGDEAPPRRILWISAALGSLTILFGGVAGFHAGLANARGRHVSGSATILVYNIIVCGAILLFHESIGALSVLVGILLAEASQSAVLWLAIRPVLHRVRPRFSHHDWGAMRAVFWPTTIVGLMHGINVSVDRVFATLLESGAIAALSYGEKLVNIPVSLIGTALAVPLFTRLSRYAREERDSAFSSTLLLGTRVLLIVGTPLGFLLAAASVPLISLLLARGAFSADGVRLTSLAMAGYSFGVPFQIIFTLLFSACLTRGRHWSAVLVMVLTAILNGWLDWVLVGPAGLVGIAFSTSVVALVRVVLLLWIVDPRLFRSRGLWASAGRAFLLGTITVALVLLLNGATGFLHFSGRGGQFAALALCGFLFLAICAVLWRPLLKAEWQSITRLRGAVARHAEKPAVGAAP